MALNAHRAFIGPADADHYLASLTLQPSRERLLRAAQSTCREAIRSGLRTWSNVLQKSMLFESAVAHVAPDSLKPKFKVQGSFAYRTLNEPAHTPPQEIDLDDGIFVPVSFLHAEGRSHPGLISSGYFRAVEALLTPVCRERGWRLVTDKPSCVRVELDNGAHIDFALYAIPDEEFEELVEAEVLAKAMNARGRAVLTEQIELAEDLYRGLREDQIMLAHREEGWKPSDPRKLEDWFRAALRTHGEQLRRVCRYLKGWRDHSWEACRLSSIALMACVVTTYDEAAVAPEENRDDLALLEVARRLPDLFRGRIANPVLDGQFLDEGWEYQNRQAFIREAQVLHDLLREAIDGTDSPARALSSLVRAFGERLPDDHSLIKSEEPVKLAAPVVLTSGLVKQMGSASEPQQAVKREGDRRYG
jgi:hypothetical protein